MQTSETHHTWSSEINAAGDITLSKEIRRALGWEAGDRVVLEWDGYSVRITTIGDFTREMQRSFGPWQLGESLLSDELLADRRHPGAIE